MGIEVLFDLKNNTISLIRSEMIQLYFDIVSITKNYRMLKKVQSNY